MTTRLVSATLLVAVHAGAAFAQGDVGDPLSMNALTPVSTMNLDVGIPLWDTPDNTDLTTIGITLEGHYVAPSGIGGYLVLPMSFVSYSVDTLLGSADDSEFSLGNIELGAMYAKWLGRFAVVGHVGVALPTTTSEDPSTTNLLPAGVYSPAASAPRYTDLVDRLHESTWLRLGVSPMGREGKLFWRADLSLDLALDDDSSDSLSPAFAINIGGGVDLGPAAIQVELDTLVTDSEGDDTNSVLALGARFNAGKVRPGIALLVPLGWDEDANGVDLDVAIAASLAARL